MKISILIFVLFGLFFYFLESIFNRITMGAIVEKKLEKNIFSFFCYSSIFSFFMGGLCSIIIYFFYLIPVMKKINIIIIMLIGGVTITIIELLFGIFLNKILKLNIWDYSNSKIGKIPVHFLGQIDLYHSICWILLVYPIIKIFNIINWIIK